MVESIPIPLMEITMQATQNITFGQALSSFFSAIFHAFVAAEKAAVVVESSIGLAQNEVDNMSEIQQIRLDESRSLRAQNKAALEALQPTKKK